MSARFGFERHRDLIAARGPLRVVNWHTTPAGDARALRDRLRDLQRRWDAIDLAGLDSLFDGERRGRPAFVPVFYEGYAEHVTVAAEVCSELGLVGWFAVCTGFVSCPVPEQETFARSHWIALGPHQQDAERLAMTWDEVAELARDHVVFPHTASHDGIAETVTDEDLQREVVDPKRAVDDRCGQDSAAFAWMGGTPWGTSVRHDAAVSGAGYRYVFSNTMVQRLK